MGCHQLPVPMSQGKPNPPKTTLVPTASACLVSSILVHVNCGSPSLLSPLLRCLPVKKATCLLLLLPPLPPLQAEQPDIIPLPGLHLWCWYLCLDEHFSWKSWSCNPKNGRGIPQLPQRQHSLVSALPTPRVQGEATHLPLALP